MKGSLLEREQLALGRGLLARARDQKRDLLLPVDAAVAAHEKAGEARQVGIGAVPPDTGAFDIGPQSLQALQARVRSAKTVLWSGALGVSENPAFASASSALLATLAESQAFSVVLGDSLGVLAQQAGPELSSKLGFISTGGMAPLALIEGKKLPGVEALRE
jgi:phosphoglycerate kinase